MTAPPPDPIHDALSAAESAIRDLWPALGVEPDVPDLGVAVTCDRVLALVGILEHLDPVVRQMAGQAVPTDAQVRLGEVLELMRSAARSATVTEQYMSAMLNPDRPRA